MKYSVIDTHADTASEIYIKGGSLFNNGLHVDLAKTGDIDATYFFAAFTAPKYWSGAKKHAMGIIKKLKGEIEKSDGAVLCKSYADYLQNKGKTRIFLSMEGGKAIESLADLHEFYDEGVRMISLVWNVTNQLAAGAGETDKSKGLTESGRSVICEMNSLGILTDVSHASDKTFWDIAELSQKPLIASHSNARAVTPHMRNLTNEQVAAIKKSNGYIGLNFYPPFLTEKPRALIDDILCHAEHFLSLGAEDCLGIGADFDGVDRLPDGICGAWDIYKLFDAMLRCGYPEDLVEKISHGNMERILQENL